MAEYVFPEGFLWGSASSSHQVEGNCDKNQWWEFEQHEGTIRHGEKSGAACDHYNRFNEDFETVKKLNHNAYRLSLEWSRFFPDGSKDINQEAVSHYHKVLDKLIELDITPFVTLFHFTVPLWFARKGGFELYENIKYFEQFVRFIAKEYGDKVQYWSTINEPAVFAIGGYLVKEFPPHRQNMFETLNVMKNLIYAHTKCYHILKAENPDSQVGLVKAMPYFMASNPDNPLDQMVASANDWLFTGGILHALKTGEIPFPFAVFESDSGIKGSSDYLGLNYYTRTHSSITKPLGGDVILHDEKKTLMDWTVYPEGLYQNLLRIKKDLDIPVYITENGIATDDDEWRTEYIKQHLIQVHRAINADIDVRGYFYWSNLDNFEWARGYDPTFGLIAVDRENNFERKIKPSAYEYAKIIADNGFED